MTIHFYCVKMFLKNQEHHGTKPMQKYALLNEHFSSTLRDSAFSRCNALFASALVQIQTDVYIKGHDIVWENKLSVQIGKNCNMERGPHIRNTKNIQGEGRAY